MKEMIKKYVASVVCTLATLLITGSALAVAPTPVAVWSGDFNINEKAGISIAANSNQIAGDGSSITIADPSKGVQFDLSQVSDFGQRISVIVKYADLSQSGISGHKSLISVGQAGSGQTTRDDVGVCTTDSTKFEGYFTTTCSNYGVLTYTAPESGYVLFNYSCEANHNIGVSCYFGTKNDDGTYTWSGRSGSASLRFTNAAYRFTNLAIGGPNSSSFGPITGMKIEAVAIFNSDLDTTAAAAYVFPPYDVFMANFSDRIMTITSTGNAGSGVDLGGSATFALFDPVAGADTTTTFTGSAATTKLPGYIGQNKTRSWWGFASNQAGYSAPGLVMRFPTYVTGRSITVGGTFAPYTVGGLIVEEGASSGSTVPSWNQGSGNRYTELGDKRESDGVPTFFVLRDNFKIVRGDNNAGNAGVQLYGDITFDIASGKYFDCNTSKPNGKIELKPGAIFRMVGEGTFKVSTLNAIGEVALDYSKQSPSTTFITGSLTINDSTGLILPDTLAENAPFALCSGTLSGATSGLRVITVGDKTDFANLTFEGNTVKYVWSGAPTKATATIQENTNWSNIGWDDDVEPTAAMAVELTFGGNYTLTLDEEAVGNSFLIKGNSSADQTIKIAGSAANVAAFATKVTLDSTFTGNIEYEFDATASGFTADDALKTSIKAATTKTKYIFKGANNIGVTMDLGDTGNGFATHLVFNGGKHTLRIVNGNHLLSETGSAENPTILVKTGTMVDFTAKDLSGWGNGYNINGVIRVNSGATLNYLQNGNDTCFYRQRLWLDPGSLTTFNYTINGTESRYRWHGGAASGYEQIYVPASDNDQTGNPAIIRQLGVGGLHLASDNTRGLGVFVGANSRLVLDTTITGATTAPLKKFGDGVLEVVGDVSLPTADMFEIVAGKLALGGTVNSLKLDAATEIEVAGGKTATITALTGDYAITKTGAGTLNLPSSYVNTVTLEGGFLNNDFAGNLKIAYALDLTNVTSFPIGGTVVASGNTGSIKLPASFVDGKIVKFAGDDIVASGLTVFDSTGTDITNKLQIVDGHIAMVAQEITATLDGSYYPDWKELPWDGERTWSDGLKAILTIANENVYITVPDPVSASIVLEGEGNVSFTCAGNLVCDAIDATELDGAISFSSSNVTTIRAGDNNVDYAYTGNAHVALNIETTGAIKVENTTGAQVDINAGASDLTYKYTGNTPIAPSISTTGNFTKEGPGTITGLNFGTDYAGQVTINAGMISSDYLSFGATPHVTIAAGATWQNTHDNVSLQDQARDYSNVTGSGRLEFKSLSTAANAWRAIPVSMDKMWAQSLEFVVSEKDGAILSGVGVDYVMGSLSGDCKLRYDFSSGTRSLKVVQSRDTTWNGTFLNSYNERFSTFTVDGTGSDSHILTLAGTFDNSHPLVVTANGAVKVTGAWQGNVTVNGEFGGSGQVKSATEITFNDGATLRADWGAFTLNVAPTFGETLNVTLPAETTAAGYKILTLTNAAEKYINVDVTVKDDDEKDYILEQKADGIYLVEKGANGVVITVPENEEVTKTLATGLNYEKTGLGTLLVKGTIEGTLTISAGEAVIMPGASVGTIVTTGTGKDLYGYTVNVNNCGKFAIPSGKTADKIRIFDAVGNPLDITDSDERYVYFDWEITDDACWWDYEFNGNVNNTGTEGTALKWDNDRPGGADFTDDGKLYAVKRPWRDVSTWPSVATFVMYGTMPSNDNRYYVVFGSSGYGTYNTIFLATDNVADDKVVLCKAHGKNAEDVEKLCTMTVPNAQTAEHLYAFVLKKDAEQTIIDIYLDGELLQSYPFGEVINLGTGFQISSPHGGPVAGYSRPENTDQATLDWLRVYDLELTKEALEKYAEEYPYVSPNGSYQRTVMAGANWSATDAWTKEGTEPAEKADEPAAGATVKLAIDNEDATTTIAINLADDVAYEAIQINGDDVKFVLAEGVDFGGIVKSTGRVTANANITFAYDAFSMENAPLTVKQGKTVTFDLSMVDMTQFFSKQTYDLTGYLTLEEDANVAFIVPSELHGRTASAAIDPHTKHYVLTITVPDNPFTYTDGAWTWGTQSVTAEIVSANPGTAVTVASGTLEWPMDRASFTVNGGTLKATAAPTVACAIAVNAGAAFDVNGKGSTQYAITLNGGEIANTGNGTFVTGLTVTADSSVNLTSGLSIQSSDGGWDPTTIALGDYTLTKKGDGQFTFVMTTITGAGTLDIQSGKVYSSESTTFTDGTIKIASGATYQQRGARTTTVAKIIGVDGAILQNNSSDGAGVMSAFTLEGALELAGGSGTFGVITLDEAALDIDTVRGLTVAGTGSVKATITAAEQTSGAFTLFTKTEDAAISSVTLVDEDGETLTPSSAGFDEDGNYVVAFSVAITAQPREHTYAASVTWGDGTQTTTFVNNVAMIPAGATNVKVQFNVLDPEYTFSTGSQVYEVELGTVTSATTATIPAGVTVGPIVAMVGDYPNTKFYPSLALAIAAVEDGETISMFASDENETTITKSVTIEVGTSGSTPNSINVNATANTGVTINFKKGGVVTGTIGVSGGIVNFQTAGDNVGGNFTGTLTYSSGTVTRNADYAVTAPEGYLWYGTDPLTLISSEFTWIGASGDNWNDPTKWQGAVVPVAGAKAIINLGDNAGDYTINLPEATAALASLTLSGSATSFAFAGTGSLSAETYNISGLTATTLDLSKTTFNAAYTIPANSTLIVNGATWTSEANFDADTSKIRYAGAYTAIGGTFAGEKGTVEFGGTYNAAANTSFTDASVKYAIVGTVNVVSGNFGFGSVEFSLEPGCAVTVAGNFLSGDSNGSKGYFNGGTLTANKIVIGTKGSGTGASEDYYFGDGSSANNTMVITANEIYNNYGNNSTGMHVHVRNGCTINLKSRIWSDATVNNSYRHWFLEGGKFVITDNCSILFQQLRSVTGTTEFEVADSKTLTLTVDAHGSLTKTGVIRKTGTGTIVFANNPAASFTIAAGTAIVDAGNEGTVSVDGEGSGVLKVKVAYAQWISGYTSPATIPEGKNIVFVLPDSSEITGNRNVLPPKAADRKWVGTTDSNWNVATNWEPEGVPGENDSVEIDSTDKEIAITVPNGGVTVGGITFKGGNAIALTGGAINVGVVVKADAGRAAFIGGTIGTSIQVVGGTLAISGDYTLPAEIATESGATLELDVASAKTITSVISGAGAFKKTGEGTLTMNGLSSYTGGTTVEAGGIVFGATSQNSVGPIGAYYAGSTTNWDYNKAVVKNGAFIDVNGKADMCYTFELEEGAVLKNAGSTIGEGNRQTRRVALLGNATVDAVSNAFGIHNGSHNATQLALGEYTLTKIGNGAFELVNTVISGTGTIDVQAGTLWFNTRGSAMNDGTIKFGANGALQVSANATVKNFIANNTAITGNGTLIVTGLLDLSAVENNTLQAVNLTLTEGMTFKFPAGYMGESKFTLCSGTLTPASGTLNANIDFGNKIEQVQLVIADKGITFEFPDTTWTGGESGEETDWDVATNWTHGVPKATTAVTIPADANISLTSASIASSITLEGSATLTMDGVTAANIKNIAIPADATLTINVEEGNTATVGLISGAGAVAKSGAGTLTLSGVNTFSGGTTVEAGVIVRGNGSAFGASMSTIDVKSGAALNWNDTATRNDNVLYRVKLAGNGVGDGKGAFYTSTNNNTLSAGNRHPISLELTGNASIGSANNFGVMYYLNGAYSVATVNLNGYTLTKVGSGIFYTSNIEFSNGTVVVNEGTLSVINNMDNDTFHSDAKLVVGENGHLQAFRNLFTVYDVEFKAAENTVTKSDNNHLFIVKGTVTGSFSTDKLKIAAGATIPVTSEITVSSALTLDGSIVIDLGATGSGNFRVITAPTGYVWETSNVTLSGSDITDWNVSAEGTTLVVSKLPLDATVDDADGYNFGEKIIEVDVTKIDPTLKGTQIKVVTSDKSGTQVGEATLFPIDGKKDKYQVVIGGLTAGETYNFKVTFVDSKGVQIDQSKEANLKNIAVGTLIEGEDIFSADATSGDSVVDGGYWTEEQTISEGKYVIDDETASVFTVTADDPEGNFTIEYDLSFEPGFATELTAEATAPIAGLTIGEGDTDETTNWYRADSEAETGWSKLDQSVTPGHYIIRMAFTDSTVTYSVKGDEDPDFVTLKQNETTSAFPITSSTIQSVSFQGSSSLAKFGAKTDDTIDTAIALDSDSQLIDSAEGVVTALSNGKTVTLKTNVSIDTSTLDAGTYTINGGFKVRWSDTDKRIITYANGVLTISDTEPTNGFTSFENYVLQLDPGATPEAAKPYGVAPADNGKPNTLTIEIKKMKSGVESPLEPVSGYTVNYIATEVGTETKVISNNPKIDLPLPESGEVQYTIKIEVIKE